MEPWKVWNVAEKPCCFARCRMDRNEEAGHIFKYLSEIYQLGKRERLWFFPKVKGSIVISELALL